MRGAGHNFGIVTEATYRIYDAANEGMQYKADVYFDTPLVLLKPIYTKHRQLGIGI